VGPRVDRTSADPSERTNWEINRVRTKSCIQNRYPWYWTCPLRAWRSWVERAGITKGPLFRWIDRHGNIAECRLSDRRVALTVKRWAQSARIDPATVSGHPLRSRLGHGGCGRTVGGVGRYDLFEKAAISGSDIKLRHGAARDRGT
jgi:hypothetical protein